CCSAPGSSSAGPSTVTIGAVIGGNARKPGVGRLTVEHKSACGLPIRARSSRPLSLCRCIDQLRIVRRITVSAFVLAAGLHETPMPPSLLLTILGLNG